MNHNQRKTVERSPEQHASGRVAELGLDVAHFPAQDLLRRLQGLHQAAGLTLADVSSRCDIDECAPLCRLENGHTRNPYTGHALALRRRGWRVSGEVFP
ncbi:MAG TPA: hypothetical protein VND64_01535 [Pirellulales bacterium]|nr:hypothetical protein [Pirellulales bacterium]